MTRSEPRFLTYLVPGAADLWCAYPPRCFCNALPRTAFADAGLPTIFVTIPAMLIALVVVVAIEAFIIAVSWSFALGRRSN